MPFFVPLFFVQPGHLPLAESWRPALTSALIYFGSWSTFAAVKRADVSLVTPVLGTKVVFVALAFVALSGKPLSPGLWTAALLATAGVFVIGAADLKPGNAPGPAIALCLASSLFFGVTDVLIGQWAPHYGGTAFLASIPQFLGLFSLTAILFSPAPVLRLPREHRFWVLGGAVVLAAQGMAMGLALAFFNDPTGVNILYSTRGLWSLILVWAIGSWFANHEHHRAGRRTMGWRLTGTVLITAGVVLAVLERSR